jgi:CRP-like cAMP-binding protein
MRQGEVGHAMYVLLEGEVEVEVAEEGGARTTVARLGPGEFLGEMALFDGERRSATVRARGPVRALTVDKRNLLARITEDPTLAFRLIRSLCGRVRRLDDEVARRPPRR